MYGRSDAIHALSSVMMTKGGVNASIARQRINISWLEKLVELTIVVVYSVFYLVHRNLIDD
jgi:hypothetical protein